MLFLTSKVIYTQFKEVFDRIIDQRKTIIYIVGSSRDTVLIRDQ